MPKVKSKTTATRPSSYKFESETLALVSEIREHLSGLAHGANVTASDAIRYALRVVAEKIRAEK